MIFAWDTTWDIKTINIRIAYYNININSVSQLELV